MRTVMGCALMFWGVSQPVLAVEMTTAQLDENCRCVAGLDSKDGAGSWGAAAAPGEALPVLEAN